MSVLQRVYKGIGANAFGQAVSTFIQLLSVPLLVSVWGLEKYGEWLVISAIPAYLTFSDLGLAAAGGNKVSMVYERGFKGLSVRLYRACFVFVTLFFSVFLLLFLNVIFFVDVIEVFNINNFQESQVVWVLFGLMLHVLLVMQSNVIAMPYRANKRAPLGVLVLNLTRLFEWCVALIMVWIYKLPELLVMSLVLIRVVGNVGLLQLGRKVSSDFNLRRLCFDRKAIKVLIKPAVASMAFPIGLALSIQGATLLVSAYLGGVAVALFNVYRTLSRVLVQLATVINQAVWPELTYAYARTDVALIKKILSKVAVITVPLSAVLIALIYVFSEEIMLLWLQQKVEQDSVLLILMLLVAFVHIYWQRYWVFLMAANRHVDFARMFLFVSMLALALMFVLVGFIGVLGAPIALLFGEVCLVLLSRKVYSEQVGCLC